MEQYQGVKFQYRQLSDSYPQDGRLATLNRWAGLLASLGLTPLHSTGAYGNLSYRFADNSFIISRSGMTPEENLQPGNFVLVENYDATTGTFSTRGTAPPSSESLLHHMIYQKDQTIQAILHGHSPLLTIHAKTLDIPVTSAFHAYGTAELAESALATMEKEGNFFLLKEHGFVALGTSINDAGLLTLSYYERLIALLRRTL